MYQEGCHNLTASYPSAAPVLLQHPTGPAAAEIAGAGSWPLVVGPMIDTYGSVTYGCVG